VYGHFSGKFITVGSLPKYLFAKCVFSGFLNQDIKSITAYFQAVSNSLGALCLRDGISINNFSNLALELIILQTQLFPMFSFSLKFSHL